MFSNTVGSTPRCRATRAAATLFGLVLVSSLIIVGAAPANAQDAQSAIDNPIYSTCADVSSLQISGGDELVEAATALRESGAPNPPGLEVAFDQIIANAATAISDPTSEPFASALAKLVGYYGGQCEGLDTCPLVLVIRDDGAREAGVAADLLQLITLPDPPGIQAPFAIVANGDLTDPEFEGARDRIVDFRSDCAADDGGTLAFTGASETTRLLSLFGFGLLATGCAAFGTSRRRDQHRSA